MAERHGNGRPSVVALHGWGRDSSDWGSVLRSTNALALDLPGFGSTPAPETPWGSAQYAELVLKAVDGVVTAPFVLVGHSFGGRVAVQLAASRPDLISRLILTGVPLYRRTAPAKPPITFRAAKALSRANILSDGLMERMRQRYGSPDYRATSGVMRGVFVTLVNEDYQRAIDRIAASNMPVSLIWGEEDHEVPLGVANRVHDKLSVSDLRVVPAAGHLISEPLAAELRSAIVGPSKSAAQDQQ